MFLAVIIPQAKKDKIVCGLVVFCFIASFVATYIPFVKDMSDGTRTIILTVLISAGAAILFPRRDDIPKNTDNIE
jgi:hypothetical protein